MLVGRMSMENRLSGTDKTDIALSTALPDPANANILVAPGDGTGWRNVDPYAVGRYRYVYAASGTYTIRPLH